MGRKKKQDKKVKISVTIDEDLIAELEEFGINTSKYINWLLVNYLTQEDLNEQVTI